MYIVTLQSQKFLLWLTDYTLITDQSWLAVFHDVWCHWEGDKLGSNLYVTWFEYSQQLFLIMIRWLYCMLGVVHCSQYWMSRCCQLYYCMVVLKLKVSSWYDCCTSRCYQLDCVAGVVKWSSGSLGQADIDESRRDYLHRLSPKLVLPSLIWAQADRQKHSIRFASAQTVQVDLALISMHTAPTLPESEVFWLCVAGRDGRVMADLKTQHITQHYSMF